MIETIVMLSAFNRQFEWNMIFAFMRNFILTLLIPFSLSAITFEISHPCNDSSLEYNYELNGEINVGELTISILEKEKIPFIGTEAGINSILNTPNGMNAYDITSNNTMYAYGWCYKVNGFEPSAYPNTYLKNSNDHVLWWFGYATFSKGQWITHNNFPVN